MRTPRVPSGVSESSETLRQLATLSFDIWKWLEELRQRFELAIEVLDRDLEFVLPTAAEGGHVSELRAAIAGTGAGALREAALAAMRTQKPRSLTVGSQRVRVSPLSSRAAPARTAVAVLLVADVVSARAQAHEGLEAADRRLDAVSQWLTASVEATIELAGASGEESRLAQRFATIIDVVEALSRLEEPRAIMQLLIEAIAWWFDADVRAYREDFEQRFVLDLWLPGVKPSETGRTLAAVEIWDRDEVFSLETDPELEQLGWDPTLHDTLFVPIAVGDSVEWLVTVSGARDRSAQSTLSFLQRSTSLMLTALDRSAVEQARRRTSTALGFGDTPFDASVRLALEAAAADVRGSSARVAIYYGATATPALSLTWGPAMAADSGFLEPGTMTSAPDRIVIGTPLGIGVSAVFEIRSGSTPFTAASCRVVESGVAVIANWLSGVFQRRTDLGPAATEQSLELVQRLHADVDRTGRLRSGGVMIVVVLDPASRTGPALDEVVQLVHDQVRPSDVIGTVGRTGAGVLLRDVRGEAARVIVDRLRRASEERGLAHLAVAAEAFSPLSQSPEELLQRAIASARHQQGPS